MTIVDLLWMSLGETLKMVGVSIGISILLGIPLAICLVLTIKGGLKANRFVYGSVSFFVNATRSVPYLILMVVLMPTTRFLVGTSIGVWAATVPLSVAGILLLSRLLEDGMKQIDPGVLEVGLAAGATTSQIVRTIILPESLPLIISSVTTVTITIIGFSAMAGVVGGGGLGDLAVRYGYQRYDVELLVYIVLILMVMVNLIQWLGNCLVRVVSKGQ